MTVRVAISRVGVGKQAQRNHNGTTASQLAVLTQPEFLRTTFCRDSFIACG